MTLQEIKDAIERGDKVYWMHTNCEVIKDRKGQYLMKAISGYCIGLTWADGVTLNGKESDFYVLN